MAKKGGPAKKPAGKMATIAKVRNKQLNKAKRTSYREEKEIRKAQKLKANTARTVTVNQGGEMVSIDQSSRKGKKLVARLKRKLKEQKRDTLAKQRHTGITQDIVADVLSGKVKPDASAVKDAASKREQKKLVELAQTEQQLTRAQQQIQAMKERAKRGYSALSLKKQRAEERKRREAEQDREDGYEEEETIRFGSDHEGDDDDDLDISLGDSDIDSSDDDGEGSEDMISDDFDLGYDKTSLSRRRRAGGKGDDDDDDDHSDDDDDDSNALDVDTPPEPISPEESELMASLDHVAQKIRREKRDLPGHLFVDLPKLKPLPPKMIAIIKQRGQNPKTVQAEREREHAIKINKILIQRENAWREYDSDDDNSEADENDEALLQYFGNINEDALAQSKPLERLKQDTQEERRAQRAEMAQRLAELKEQQEKEKEKEKATKQQQQQQQQTQKKRPRDSPPSPQATSTNAPQADSHDDGEEDAELQRRKELLRQRRAGKSADAATQNDRLMVLLDDGTWGYRDDDTSPTPTTASSTTTAESGDTTSKPEVDLSAYVRKPKEKKKKARVLAAEQADAEAEAMAASEPNSDILERFQQFVSRDGGQPTKSKEKKSSQQPKQKKTMVDENDEQDDDFDEDDEFEYEESSDVEDDTPNPSREVQHFYKARLGRIHDAQILIGQLSTEILENPEKNISAGHMESLLQLCRDNDNTIRQLAIVSCAAVFGDIIPAYRFKPEKKQPAGAPEIKLTKVVKAKRDYEANFLNFYKQLCTILHRNVQKGLKVFNMKRGITEDGEQIMPPLQTSSNASNAKDITQVDLSEKENTLYLVSLKSLCRLFTKAYHFNFNTQLASLLATVLISDHTEWADIAAASVAEVFKLDKCSESTIEIVQCIGNLCKKRAGERMRAPLLQVLLELPLSYRVIHYEDPNKERREQEEKQMRKLAKKEGKIKGKLGAGHHYFMKQMEETNRGVKQMKKAMRSGKDFDIHQSSIVQKEKAHQSLVRDVERGMKESDAIVGMDERKRNQTKVLSIVFTIFFRYLKQAPTIKTLYNMNMQNEQQTTTAPTVDPTRPQPTTMTPAPSEAAKQAAADGKVLTNTMLGVVAPPSHRVFSVVLRGVMKYAQLINLELVLDLLQHLLKVVEATTETNSLPLASSLMCIETTFTLLQMHCSAIEIDLAPHYQVFYQVIWQLLYEPHQTPLVIKCLDLSILQRKHIPPRRIAAICRRLMQVSLHLPPQYALPLTQIVSQCTTAHPTIGAYYDNDRLQSGQYLYDAPNPDTSDAISWPAWEATSFGLLYHPYAPTMNMHTILSDIRLGTSQNSEGRDVNNGIDRSKLSISLTSVVPDDEGRPRRQTHVIAVNRLKALELYVALDVSRGGFCPDVVGPDAKKQRKLIHNDFYMNYDHYVSQGLQSVALNDILEGESIHDYLATPVCEDGHDLYDTLQQAKARRVKEETSVIRALNIMTTLLDQYKEVE